MGRDTIASDAALITAGRSRCCTVCNATYRSDFQRCPADGAALVEAVTDPLLGTTIGRRYVVEAVLGEGGMARVYRAHHHKLSAKRYAIKILHGDLAMHTTMRIRFANEARNTSRLTHPNIIDVVDFGRTETGLLYLAMDLVDGVTLGKLIQHGTMPVERVVRLTRQLCRGLAHAHAAGVIHRDFKPDNILVIGEGDAEVARIADFGLAITTDHDPRLTASGVMCTPAYAAPEQIIGGVVDHRSDLYALGGTLFEMLTGTLPFGRERQGFAAKLGTPAPSVQSAAPHVPRQLAAVVDRLLARDPARRFASADDVLAALDACRTPILRSALLPPRDAIVTVGKHGAVLAVAAGAIALGAFALPERDGAATAPAAALAPAMARTPAAMDVATAPVAPALHHPLHVPALPHHVIAHAGAPRIAELTVEGGLPASSIRRAIERVLPTLRGCAELVWPNDVTIDFAVADSRRALALRGSGAGATCVTAALAAVRTAEAPDVGGVAVHVRIAFDAAQPAGVHLPHGEARTCRGQAVGDDRGRVEATRCEGQRAAYQARDP